MMLLLDVGNTNTHLGLATPARVVRTFTIPTVAWREGRWLRPLRSFVGPTSLAAAAFCCVVPSLTRLLAREIRARFGVAPRPLRWDRVRHFGYDYPRPETIGADRLANLIALKVSFGAPAIAIDLGTATTFEVLNRSGNFAGGIIAPGLDAMLDYLHERTARLPRVRLGQLDRALGQSTSQAIHAAATFGYPAMIQGLIDALRGELGSSVLPVVATGGAAAWVAKRVSGITAVEPRLTLDGLRLFANG